MVHLTPPAIISETCPIFEYKYMFLLIAAPVKVACVPIIMTALQQKIIIGAIVPSDPISSFRSS